MKERYSFYNDYSEGAHPRILAALEKSNLVQEDGYGLDRFCKRARTLIRKEINLKADVHFASGGTQANLLVISHALRPYEAVIAPLTGHVYESETGAIEATGHKVCTVPSSDGKLRPRDVQHLLDLHVSEHEVLPRLVYISNSTELGTVYTKKELEELSCFCKKHNLYLFIDGARMGAAMCAKKNDMTLADIARYADVFYISGTKAGCLLGEAIVITHHSLKTNFRHQLKQRGAMLSKGRVLGLQFCELFSDGLFYELSCHAFMMAEHMAQALKSAGFQFFAPPETNQLFPIFPNKVIDTLLKHFKFYKWKKVDNKHTAVRLVTSWATPVEKVEEFCDLVKKINI